MERLLRVRTVAERLNITTRAVYHLINDGKLPGVRVTERALRVKEQDLEAYLEKLAQRQKERVGYSQEELQQLFS